MKFLKTCLMAAALLAGTALAADLRVQNATLWGPNGNAQGKLVMRGDQMTFIDDNNPDMSFIIPKSEVKSARWENGRLTINLAHPYERDGGTGGPDLVFVMPDQSSAGSIISWMGVPVAGYSGEADRSSIPPSNTQITDVRFDVRNGDQHGKLLLQNDELVFESLTDAKHSRHWKYSDIRELTRDKHELKIQPYHGDKYEFQFNNRAMLDTVYNLLSDRVVDARHGH
jgi:hypothetical protein